MFNCSMLACTPSTSLAGGTFNAQMPPLTVFPAYCVGVNFVLEYSRQLSLMEKLLIKDMDSEWGNY
jgi:hypothetical protein